MLASRSRVGRQRSDRADLVLAVAVDRRMPKALAEIAVRTVVDRRLLRLGPLLHWGPHANPRRTRPRQSANRSRNDVRAHGVRTHRGQGRQTPSGTSLSSGQTLRRWRSRAGRLRHALLLPVACRARALQKGGSAKADGSSAPDVRLRRGISNPFNPFAPHLASPQPRARRGPCTAPPRPAAWSAWCAGRR